MEIQTISQLKEDDYLQIDIFDDERNNNNLRYDGIWEYQKRYQRRGVES